MKNTLAVGTALAAALWVAPSLAQDQPNTAVGGPGESCRARSDCKSGLKCVNQACADEHEGQSCAATGDCGGELKCIAKKCTSGATPTYSTPGGDKGGGGSSAGMQDWLGFKLEGLHPFAGLTLGGGFMTPGLTGNFSGGFNAFSGDFLFALHGGIFLDKHQFKLELSPFTYFFYLGIGNRGPAFELTGSYAYFIPLYEAETVQVYWPLRVGLGFVAGADNTAGLVSFQPTADVVGVGIKVGHMMFDLHLPSFRYAVTDSRGTQGHVLAWIFGASMSYVF